MRAGSQQFLNGTGVIRGIVKDSATRQPLPMATVSVYRLKDSMFLKALFSGNNGSFALRTMPLDTAIRVTVSYVGYKRFLKIMTIPVAATELDLGDILLSNNASLQEVVVTAELPPLRMKGDTLEINPAAFNAGPNAVVEDMLKKVPGVVIWGDNKITVNGKPVKEVLVEGKPFLTGSMAVATQNLPAQIIQKAQVYAPENDPESRILDLKLKAGMKNGRFGNFSVAGGTDGRYEADVTWNMFKPKQQLSAGIAANNTNKVSGSLSDMLRFNTYRGNISNPSHQSDFSREGTNQYVAAGIGFNKELGQDRLLRTDYFGYYNIQDTRKSQLTATLIGDSSFLGNDLAHNHSKNMLHQASGSYVWIMTPKRALSMEAKIAAGSEKFTGNSLSSTAGSGGSLLNQSIRDETGLNQHQNLEIKTFFDNHPVSRSRELISIEHALGLGSYNNNRTNINKYEEYGPGGNVPESASVNRRFEEKGSGIENRINATYQINWLIWRLRNMLIKKQVYLNASLLNNLHHTYNKGNTDVNDYNTSSDIYNIANSYLTNTNKQHYLEERPGIRLSINRERVLSGRYSKKLDLSGKIEWQYKLLDNHSDKQFRTLLNQYVTWLPSATFTYKLNKVQAFSKQWSVKYFTGTRIPYLNELAPITDSTNLLTLYIGNPALRMQYFHNGEIAYAHTSLKNNQTIGVQFNIQDFKRKIILNSYITPQGRQEITFANTNNYRETRIDVNYSRPVKLKQVTLNIDARAGVRYETGDMYINRQKGTFQNDAYSVEHGLNLIMGHTELMVNQSFNWTKNRINISEQSGTAGFAYIMAAMIQQRSGRLTAASNLNLTYYAATQVESVSRYIWNVSMDYSITRNDQFHLRLSFNDLLKQNQKIANAVYLNTVVKSEVNRLTQFALISFIYYPRKFGNK